MQSFFNNFAFPPISLFSGDYLGDDHQQDLIRPPSIYTSPKREPLAAEEMVVDWQLPTVGPEPSTDEGTPRHDIVVKEEVKEEEESIKYLASPEPPRKNTRPRKNVVRDKVKKCESKPPKVITPKVSPDLLLEETLSTVHESQKPIKKMNKTSRAESRKPTTGTSVRSYMRLNFLLMATFFPRTLSVIKKRTKRKLRLPKLPNYRQTMLKAHHPRNS